MYRYFSLPFTKYVRLYNYMKKVQGGKQRETRKIG